MEGFYAEATPSGSYRALQCPSWGLEELGPWSLTPFVVSRILHTTNRTWPDIEGIIVLWALVTFHFIPLKICYNTLKMAMITDSDCIFIGY